MLSFQKAPLIPFMTIEKYSRETGIPIGTIKDYISKGKIIIKKKEKNREKPLINMIAMNELAAREAEMLLP